VISVRGDVLRYRLALLRKGGGGGVGGGGVRGGNNRGCSSQRLPTTMPPTPTDRMAPTPGFGMSHHDGKENNAQSAFVNTRHGQAKEEAKRVS
jgi:hypothetical protein